MEEGKGEGQLNLSILMSSDELRFLQERKWVVRGITENKHKRGIYTCPEKNANVPFS